MFIKVDENGIILSHDYQLTENCTIEINDTILVNSNGNYKYKYINNQLVELSAEEILAHPCRIANKLSEIREQRNRLLAECDYIMCSDSDASETCINSFITYRQSLRDITDNIDVDDFEYPSKPTYEKS